MVVDPFIGVGTTAVAAIMHQRRAAGAEIVPEYLEIAKKRITQAKQGTLRTRPMNKPIYQPSPTSKITKNPFCEPISP